MEVRSLAAARYSLRPTHARASPAQGRRATPRCFLGGRVLQGADLEPLVAAAGRVGARGARAARAPRRHLPSRPPPDELPISAQLGVDLAELICRSAEWRSICLPLASTCRSLRALLLPRLLERRRDTFRDALLMA